MARQRVLIPRSLMAPVLHDPAGLFWDSVRVEFLPDALGAAIGLVVYGNGLGF